MDLKLVFIGYNEAQTRRYFAEFAEINQDQIWRYNPDIGIIRMYDGTVIYRAPSHLTSLYGLHIDQVIVACDECGVRGWPTYRLELLDELIRRAERLGQVPAQDRVIIYELDSKEVPF